eukprot:121624-Pelagomonas_calceolata.AAC.4
MSQSACRLGNTQGVVLLTSCCKCHNVPAGLATPGPLHADSLDQPEAQQGVEDHLISYTDPVTAAPHAMPKTGGRARPKE